MKSAAAEPGAARARFRRGGQCQKDAHDKQWDFHTNKPAFLSGETTTLVRLPFANRFDLATTFVEHRYVANIVAR
jgi:hypothetical protein